MGSDDLSMVAAVSGGLSGRALWTALDKSGVVTTTPMWLNIVTGLGVVGGYYNAKTMSSNPEYKKGLYAVAGSSAAYLYNNSIMYAVGGGVVGYVVADKMKSF